MMFKDRRVEEWSDKIIHYNPVFLPDPLEEHIQIKVLIIKAQIHAIQEMRVWITYYNTVISIDLIITILVFITYITGCRIGILERSIGYLFVRLEQSH